MDPRFKALEPFLSTERKNRFENVLEWRMRHICLVLENVYQSRNASAVMRTCDGCGIQDVHLIEDMNPDSGGMQLITEMWQNTFGGFKNASQNYSQVALASNLILEELVYNECNSIYNCNESMNPVTEELLEIKHKIDAILIRDSLVPENRNPK